MAKIEIRIPDWLDKICAWPVVCCRKRRYGDPFRRIPLGEGLFALVSPKDFYRLNNFHWYPERNDKRIYAVRSVNPYDKKKKTVSMHREIMDFPAGFLVDHRNNDGIDNRRENLRLATHSQNRCNSRRNKANCSSQFRGVSIFRRRGVWYARIKINGKTIFLGYFDSEIDAARAYDRAAIKYHGEFARLNFPREDYAVKA